MVYESGVMQRNLVALTFTRCNRKPKKRREGENAHTHRSESSEFGRFVQSTNENDDVGSIIILLAAATAVAVAGATQKLTN